MYPPKLYKGSAINSRPSQLKAGNGLVIMMMMMMMVMFVMITMMKKTATLSSTSSGFSTRSS